MTRTSWMNHHFASGSSGDLCTGASASSSYHNGGVEGSAFANWYDSTLAGSFPTAVHHGGGRGSGGTKGFGSNGTDGSGSDGAGETIRESFEWDLAPDADGPDPVENHDDLSSGFTQNTGHVDVTFSVVSSTDHVVSEFYTADQNTADIVTDGAPADSTSAMSSYLTAEDASATYELAFSESVTDVSFRINDIDADAIVRVTAFDADGNEIPINLTAGSAIDLSDSDAVPGEDTADSTGDDVPSNTAAASMLVDIPGPVAKIVIEHEQDGPANSGIDVTDVYFDVYVDETGGTKGSGSGGTKGSGSGGTKGSGSGGTKGSGSGGTKGSGSGGTKGSASGGTKGSGSGGTKGSGSGGTKGSGSGGTKGSGSGGTKGSGSGGTKGSGSGGTKGSGSGGTKGSGSGGTKGSGSGGTKGSGSGGTKGSGSGGTKGSGSGGTKGFGSNGTGGSGSGCDPKDAAGLLPAFTGEPEGPGDDETVVYSNGSGPSLDDILSLMTIEPDEDDPCLKASATGGVGSSWGTVGNSGGLL